MPLSLTFLIISSKFCPTLWYIHQSVKKIWSQPNHLKSLTYLTVCCDKTWFTLLLAFTVFHKIVFWFLNILLQVRGKKVNWFKKICRSLLLPPKTIADLNSENPNRSHPTPVLHCFIPYSNVNKKDELLKQVNSGAQKV